MKEWIPHEDGWTFKWFRAVTMFGYCEYGTRTIKLSRRLTSVNDEEVVRDVILHEIAHVYAGRYAGHGDGFLKFASELGCKPKFKWQFDVTPPPRWVVFCKRCVRIWFYNRRTIIACRRCCLDLNGGKYSREFSLNWIRFDDAVNVTPELIAWANGLPFFYLRSQLEDWVNKWSEAISTQQRDH